LVARGRLVTSARAGSDPGRRRAGWYGHAVGQGSTSGRGPTGGRARSMGIHAEFSLQWGVSKGGVGVRFVSANTQERYILGRRPTPTGALFTPGCAMSTLAAAGRRTAAAREGRLSGRLEVRWTVDCTAPPHRAATVTAPADVGTARDCGPDSDTDDRNT
jgi:hypothetical protein